MFENGHSGRLEIVKIQNSKFTWGVYSAYQIPSHSVTTVCTIPGQSDSSGPTKMAGQPSFPYTESRNSVSSDKETSSFSCLNFFSNFCSDNLNVDVIYINET